MKKLLRLLPDKQYIQLQYFYHFKRFPNLKNPKTFNEKLQWLKLHDRKTEYTTMVDKYLVKQHVAKKIGAEYIIPTLGVWNCAKEIDFDALPNQFVLKWNHDSGSVIICKDKKVFDRQAAIEKLNKYQDHNGYWYGREWPYKNIVPRIIAEQYMEDTSHPEQKALLVYKIMNFNGEPKVVQTIQGDKTEDEVIDYFDTEWNLLDMRQNFPNSICPVARPKTFDKMLELSKEMSEGFPFLRIDFFEVNGKAYFSEYTFYSDSGMAAFTPTAWDEKLGEWIKLPFEK